MANVSNANQLEEETEQIEQEFEELGKCVLALCLLFH